MNLSDFLCTRSIPCGSGRITLLEPFVLVRIKPLAEDGDAMRSVACALQYDGPESAGRERGVFSLANYREAPQVEIQHEGKKFLTFLVKAPEEGVRHEVPFGNGILWTRIPPED